MIFYLIMMMVMAQYYTSILAEIATALLADAKDDVPPRSGFS